MEKKELNTKLNEFVESVFGLSSELDFAKMTKEDMELLLRAFENTQDEVLKLGRHALVDKLIERFKKHREKRTDKMAGRVKNRLSKMIDRQGPGILTNIFGDD